MRIAMVAPLAIKIPPEKYGGTEFVVYYLTEELVKRGHQVDLYATKDSKTSANLIPMVDNGVWSDQSMTDSAAKHLKMIFTVTEKADKYDIIHDHLGPLGTVLGRISKTPVVSTLHVPTTKTRGDLYNQVKDNFFFVSISNKQRENFPNLNYIKTVYNGVPVEDYQFDDSPDDYLFFLGRFDKIKGAREAIELAKKSGRRLIMAAKIEDQDYYKKFIKPEIDNKQIIYVGEVGFREKVKYLKKAKALVSLINWEEPFGLVVPEANACGTPVIVNPRGAFTELVKEGVNGFLTDNTIEGSIKVLNRIGEIDRQKCYQFVKDNFSVEKMVDGYEEVYKKVIG